MLIWSACRVAGESRVVKATVLTPVLGYILLILDRADGLGIIGKISDLDKANIYFLYFGLCCLAISSVNYALFCPETIKKFTSDTHFALTVLDVMTPEIARHFGKKSENWPSRKLRDIMMREQDALTSLVDKKNSEQCVRQVYINILMCFYAGENCSRSYSMSLLFVCLFVGFGMVYVPTIKTLVLVVADVMGVI